jgi:hypothetical protein
MYQSVDLLIPSFFRCSGVMFRMKSLVPLSSFRFMGALGGCCYVGKPSDL